jgi:hypothetical protein
MDLGRFLIETHLQTGRSIKDLAKTHDLSPSWLFTLLWRYRLEGPDGLEPRSRRPKRSPGRIADLYEDEIVALRKDLLDAGFDAGAETIHVHLSSRHATVPSVSTIWRVLKARGFVTPQPHKRPKSSWHRFEADLPNECWQADMTHVQLADGTVFEVLNIIDDHSRLCIAWCSTRPRITSPSPESPQGLRCHDTSTPRCLATSQSGGSGIRTHGGLHLTAFQELRICPLCHPSRELMLRTATFGTGPRVWTPCSPQPYPFDAC